MLQGRRRLKCRSGEDWWRWNGWKNKTMRGLEPAVFRCLKPAVFSWFANTTAPLPIVPEGCPRAQTDQPVFLSALKQIFFGLGLRIFCEWCHKWSTFVAILVHVAWPRAQPLGQSILPKFSLETRLESESFKPLINFLAFLVQKLWSKINELIISLVK